MNVTVTEAMRVKNQVSQKVQEIQSQAHQVQYGVMKEGDAIIGEQDTKKFEDFLQALNGIYSISEKINSILARFNVESGIADAVRQKANLTSIQNYLESAIAQSATRKSTGWQMVGTQRTAVTQIFTPYMTKSELKAKVKAVKGEIRKLQSLIDSKNSEEIDLPFEYEDIDAITVE
jgi:hypothetical protein